MGRTLNWVASTCHRRAACAVARRHVCLCTRAPPLAYALALARKLSCRKPRALFRVGTPGARVGTRHIAGLPRRSYLPLPAAACLAPSATHTHTCMAGAAAALLTASNLLLFMLTCATRRDSHLHSCFSHRLIPRARTTPATRNALASAAYPPPPPPTLTPPTQLRG